MCGVTAAQDLLGCQSLPAGIGTGCSDKIPEDKVHEAGVVIEDLRHLFQFLYDGASGDGRKKTHLRGEFLAHPGVLVACIC